MTESYTKYNFINIYWEHDFSFFNCLVHKTLMLGLKGPEQLMIGIVYHHTDYKHDLDQ